MTTAAEIQAKLGLEVADYLANVDKVVKKNESFVRSMQESGEQVKKAIEFFAVAESTKQLIEFAEQGAESAAAIQDFAEITGQSARQVQEWTYEARLGGVAQDALRAGMVKLSESMAQATSGSGIQANAFAAMGVRIKDAEGNLRPLNDVLGDVAQKFSGYADGPAKAALAVALFGKNGAELIPLLNQGRDGFEELKDKAQALGVILDTETLQKAKETGDELRTMGIVADAVKTQFAAGVQPAVHAVGEAFGEVNREGSVANVVLGAMETVFKAGASAAIFLAETIVETGEDLGAFAAEVERYAHLDFSGGYAIHQEQIQKDVEMQRHAADQIKSIWEDASKSGPQAPDDTKKPSAPIVSTGQDKAIKAQFAQQKAAADAELALLRESGREQQTALDDAYRNGLITTQAYYSQKIDIASIGAAKELDILQKQIDQTRALKASAPKEEQEALQAKLIQLTGQLQLAQAKQANAELDNQRQVADAIKQQEKALQDLSISAQDAAEKAGLTTQVNDLEQAHSLMMVSDQQYFAIRKQLELDSLAQAKQIEQERLANFKGTQDEIERETIASQNRITQHELETQEKLRTIDREAQLQRSRYALQLGQDVQQAAAQGLTKWAEGSESASQAFKDFGRSVVQDLISIAAQYAVNFAAQEALKLLGLGTTETAAAASAAAWAPAAAGASIASFGAADIAGTAGLISTYAVADGLATASSFAGAFADGGTISAGQFGLVGEEGPELFAPGVTGTVVPHRDFSDMLSGSASGPNIINNAPGLVFRPSPDGTLTIDMLPDIRDFIYAHVVDQTGKPSSSMSKALRSTHGTGPRGTL